MKQELIYNILPVKAYEIELKCFYASHFILGRIFALWNKKKKAIKVSKDYFLKIKHLKKPALWVILKELQDKNIITITRINNNNNVMIIDFTDDFIKNYVNAEIEAETEAEYIEECNNEDIEEVDCENLNAEETTTKEVTTKDYNPDDDYLPVEGWYNTDRQDFRCLLRKYNGKVPEVPEEVLNFDFGQFCDDDFENYIIDKDKVIYHKPNDMQDRSPVFFDNNNNGLSVNYLLDLRPTGELSLRTYLDLYECLTDEYNYLKNNGKI